jgi:hypothetical protein
MRVPRGQQEAQQVFSIVILDNENKPKVPNLRFEAPVAATF